MAANAGKGTIEKRKYVDIFDVLGPAIREFGLSSDRTVSFVGEQAEDLFLRGIIGCNPATLRLALYEDRASDFYKFVRDSAPRIGSSTSVERKINGSFRPSIPVSNIVMNPEYSWMFPDQQNLPFLRMIKSGPNLDGPPGAIYLDTLAGFADYFQSHKYTKPQLPRFAQLGNLSLATVQRKFLEGLEEFIAEQLVDNLGTNSYRVPAHLNEREPELIERLVNHTSTQRQHVQRKPSKSSIEETQERPGEKLEGFADIQEVARDPRFSGLFLYGKTRFNLGFWVREGLVREVDGHYSISDLVSLSRRFNGKEEVLLNSSTLNGLAKDLDRDSWIVAEVIRQRGVSLQRAGLKRLDSVPDSVPLYSFDPRDRAKIVKSLGGIIEHAEQIGLFIDRKKDIPESEQSFPYTDLRSAKRTEFVPPFSYGRAKRKDELAKEICFPAYELILEALKDREKQAKLSENPVIIKLGEKVETITRKRLAEPDFHDFMRGCSVIGKDVNQIRDNILRVSQITPRALGELALVLYHNSFK